MTSESPFLPDGRQWAWNSSSLEPGKACAREYQYRVLRGLRPKKKSVDLLFGGWYAKALELFHKDRASGVDYDDALRATVRRVLEWTWFGDEGPWQSGNANKNRETLIRSVIWYLDQYRDDTFQTVILADGRPAVELPFRFQIDDEIWLTGHIDRLVEHNGDIYIQDQKTTRQSLGSWYFKKFDLSVQMSQYAYAGKIVYKQPIKGVLIDAAQIAVGFTRFERGFTFRSDDQLDEWLNETIAAIKDIWAQAPTWRRNDAACGRYGGCDFFDVCSKPARVRETYLNADFEVAFRNPLGE
jgi:hypothetical protein